MKLTFFHTDVLYLAVLAVSFVFVVVMFRQESLRRPLNKILSNTSAMVSLLVLLAFLMMSVLDSIRFYPALSTSHQRETNYAGEPITILDFVLSGIKTRTEKTYSAPLTSFSYAREMIRFPDGQESWDYPRLKFGGANLSDPNNDRPQDIAKRIIKGIGIGFFVWIGLLVICSQVKKCITKRKGYINGFCGGLDATRIPWLAMSYTLLVMALILSVVSQLASEYHVLGTDKVGEDVLYQSLKSVRTGMVIGTLTTVATLPIAVALGIFSGYFRGWVDDLIQYAYTTLNSIPGVLLIAASMLVMQSYMSVHEQQFSSLSMRADFRLMALCLILGLTSWTGLCRLIRAETLKLRELEYVDAAKVLGTSPFMILLKHIVPNLFHIILISVALDFSSLVLAEAVLSYINIGVDPTTESWGNMINGARLELAREPVVWWSLLSAFLFMFVLVLSANLFSDALRDAFDPRKEG
jgi:peptide/nickel transport system permease protein